MTDTVTDLRGALVALRPSADPSLIAVALTTAEATALWDYIGRMQDAILAAEASVEGGWLAYIEEAAAEIRGLEKP